jgi:hypothetical protein
LKTAQIILSAKAPKLDCAVQNLSDTGACLQLSMTYGIPMSFNVVLTAFADLVVRSGERTPKSVSYCNRLPATSAFKCYRSASSLKSDATFYLIIKLSARQCGATQGPPMRDWLFLLAPPALIFYFIAYPNKFYEFVFWAKRLIG